MKMFILSGVINILLGLLIIWWSFGDLNNVLLLIPAVLIIIVGIITLIKANNNINK